MKFFIDHHMVKANPRLWWDLLIT